MYSKGICVQENKTMAMQYYLLAANQGHSHAQFNLAIHLNSKGEYAECIKYLIFATQKNRNARKLCMSIFSGLEDPKKKPIAVRCLAYLWPRYTEVLNPHCHKTLMELVLVLRKSTNIVPTELVIEMAKFVIIVWPGNHCVT